jgi:hypothetical protein
MLDADAHCASHPTGATSRAVLTDQFLAGACGRPGAGAMFFDADGRDQTALIRGLVAHLDALTEEVGELTSRLRRLEQSVEADEAILASEIEKLRAGEGMIDFGVSAEIVNHSLHR